MHSAKLPGKWLIVLCAVLLLLPILVVVSAPFHTTAVNWSHALKHTLPDQFIGSVSLVVGAACIALILGTISAWLVSVFKFPGRSFFRWALALPLALPTYIAAYIYGDLLGPTGRWSLSLFEATGVSIDIMTSWGLMVVMAAVLYPYIYLPARALFAFGSGRLQEAARTLGAGNTKLFLRVGLPLARPALAGGALLVSMEVLNDFGAVNYFGVQTLTTGIFKSWYNMGDLGTAMRIGAVLLLFVFIIRTIEKRIQRKGSYAYEPHRLNQIKLPPLAALGATIFCLLPLTLGTIIPLGKITHDLFSGGHWAKAMEYELPTALANTLLLSGCAALVAVLAGLLFVYGKRFSKGKALQSLIHAASAGYVIPGAVIAVGVMSIARFWDTHIPAFVLIGSLGLIVFAMVVRFLAISLETLQSGDKLIENALIESARNLGTNPAKTYQKVNIPLLRTSITVATILVFIEVVKELPLTLILQPFNFRTLATEAYRFAGIELVAEASVAAAFIVLCSFVPILILERQFSKRL